MTRVLYWTPGFLPDIGGPQILDAQFLPEMVARGYRFQVIAAEKNGEPLNTISFPGIEVQRFPFFQALHARDLPHIVRIRKKIEQIWAAFSPTFVHLHIMDTMGFFFLEALKKNPAPILLTLHADLSGFQSGEDSVLGKMARTADWVTAVSKQTLATARDLWPEITTRSQVIHNGLSLPLTEPAPLLFDPPVLLCVGRLVEQKGFDIALGALKLLRGAYPACRLIIAGDGPHRGALEEEVRVHGLQDSVAFHGWVAPERIPELMRQSTCVLIPSRGEEAFPLVAIQAAQQARPVIGSHTGGIPEAVLDHQTGLLVPRENSVALAEAVGLLLQDHTLANRLGQAARQHAQEHFSMQAYLNQYAEVYAMLENL